MCFAPMFLLGYLLTLHPNSYHTSDFSGAVVEAQTCEAGPGLDLKVGSGGIGSLAAQYGFRGVWGDWSVTFSPKAGVGYFDRPVPELSSQVNFSLGAQLLAGYRSVRIGLEYWHQSNAYTGDVNVGLDMLMVSSAWLF